MGNKIIDVIIILGGLLEGIKTLKDSNHIKEIGIWVAKGKRVYKDMKKKR